jgi:hypothetical protein
MSSQPTQIKPKDAASRKLASLISSPRPKRLRSGEEGTGAWTAARGASPSQQNPAGQGDTCSD